MGLPIARNLMERGFEVTGYCRSGSPGLAAAGGTVAGSPAEVASAADVLMSIVPDAAATEVRKDDIRRSVPTAKYEVRVGEKIIGAKLGATTWGEQNRQLLNALNMERTATWITIGLIQLVAALNILITLIMMVMEKHRDIAILMSMGAKAAQVRNIFVYEGALIGAVGTGIGLVLGYTLCYFANQYHWIKLDQQVYSIAYVPFEPRSFDGVWIAAAAMAVSLIATLYPARSATRIAPVESLRYE